MICALVLDLGHRREFPVDRNVLGRAMAVYPLIAAKISSYIDRTYLATDSQEVKAIALQYETQIIPPPEHDQPQGVEALMRHGHAKILEDLKRDSESLEFLAVMFTHVPTICAETIESAVESLRARTEADSAMSASKYNQWNPYDAERETKEGFLEPFVTPKEALREDVWYPDWGIFLLRPRCLDSSSKGTHRLPWLGKLVVPVKQWGGGPVDFDWQVPNAEHWLKKHGVADLTTNMELQPKPQPSPKGDRR